jgi:hypothetical protein
MKDEVPCVHIWTRYHRFVKKSKFSLSLLDLAIFITFLLQISCILTW